MLRVIGFKVWIAQKVIVQKARRKLCGQGKAAPGQQIDLPLRKRGRRLFEKPLGERAEYRQVHPRPLRLRAVLLHKVCRRADRVPKIMPHKPGHNRIQVDHRNGPPLPGRKEDVVDLGIVVGHAQGKLPCLVQIGKRAGRVLHGQQPVQLRLRALRPAAGIGRGVGGELLIAPARVVKLRYGLIQVRGVKIGKQHLELAERTPRVFHQGKVVANGMGFGGNEVEQPPEAVLVEPVGPAVPGVIKMQRDAAGLFAADVLRHTVDILHDLHRVFEHIGVDRLRNIAFSPAVRPQNIHPVGPVHVPGPELLIVQQFPLDAERLADPSQLLSHWPLPPRRGFLALNPCARPCG